jgi:hypothetical protein
MLKLDRAFLPNLAAEFRMPKSPEIFTLFQVKPDFTVRSSACFKSGEEVLEEEFVVEE